MNTSWHWWKELALHFQYSGGYMNWCGQGEGCIAVFCLAIHKALFSPCEVYARSVDEGFVWFRWSCSVASHDWITCHRFVVMLGQVMKYAVGGNVDITEDHHPTPLPKWCENKKCVQLLCYQDGNIFNLHDCLPCVDEMWMCTRMLKTTAITFTKGLYAQGFAPGYQWCNVISWN